MAVYQALELMDEQGNKTGLYHYTCTDSGGTRAVGHCSPWELCPECKGRSGLLRLPDQKLCEHCGDKGIIRKENPCLGHATASEAEEHYRQYQLDEARFDGKTGPDEQRKCKVCGAWTQGLATMEDVDVVLCDEHRNREGLERATRRAVANASV